MSDSVRPQRQQPTKLLHPWDSSSKNTRVGYYFLLQCMKVKSESEDAQSYPTLSDPMDCSLPGSSVHGVSNSENSHKGNHLNTRPSITQPPVAPVQNASSKKQNENTNPRITTSLSLAHQRKNKHMNKNSAQISSYTKLTQTTGPT